MRRRTAFEMCLVFFVMASILFACLWYANMSKTVLVVGGLNWFITLVFFVRAALRIKIV
jgi:hypothetical protein